METAEADVRVAGFAAAALFDLALEALPLLFDEVFEVFEVFFVEAPETGREPVSKPATAAESTIGRANFNTRISG